jgi:hypothetical protein
MRKIIPMLIVLTGNTIRPAKGHSVLITTFMPKCVTDRKERREIRNKE